MQLDEKYTVMSPRQLRRLNVIGDQKLIKCSLSIKMCRKQLSSTWN
jgi:hypothetical protein